MSISTSFPSNVDQPTEVKLVSWTVTDGTLTAVYYDEELDFFQGYAWQQAVCGWDALIEGDIEGDTAEECAEECASFVQMIADAA